MSLDIPYTRKIMEMREGKRKDATSDKYIDLHNDSGKVADFRSHS